jgi:hypothetical protein
MSLSISSFIVGAILGGLVVYIGYDKITSLTGLGKAKYARYYGYPAYYEY